jgi:hypothetical protein
MKQVMYKDCEITIWNNGCEEFPWEGYFVVKEIPFKMRFLLDRDRHDLGTSTQTEKHCMQLMREAVDAYLEDKERIYKRAGKYWHDVGYDRGGVQVIIDFQDALEEMILNAWGAGAITEEQANEMAKKFNLEWPEDEDEEAVAGCDGVVDREL